MLIGVKLSDRDMRGRVIGDVGSPMRQVGEFAHLAGLHCEGLVDNPPRDRWALDGWAYTVSACQ